MPSFLVISNETSVHIHSVLWCHWRSAPTFITGPPNVSHVCLLWKQQRRLKKRLAGDALERTWVNNTETFFTFSLENFFFSFIKKLFIAYACCVFCRKNLLQASGKRYKPWFFSIIAPSVFCFLLLFFSLFTLLEKWQMAQHASHLEPTASTES